MLTEHPGLAVPAEEDSQTPAYEPPTVLSYSHEDLMGELGPAHACSFSGSVVGCSSDFDQWLKGQGYSP